MFGSNLFRYFKIGRKDKEKVTGFIDAYRWIDTYNKAGEYDTAIMAARELLLKVKSGITYYLEAQKKVATLASSNIPEIAKKAKSKNKIIDSELDHLYGWETKLRKAIVDCEEKKSVQNEKREKERIEGEIQLEVKVIKEHIQKKEASQAYHLAKKLLSAHHDSQDAIDILHKAQNLYNKSKSKEDVEAEENKKQEKFFREVGIKLAKSEIEEEKKNSRQEWPIITKLKTYYGEALAKRKEQVEYIKRQKSLRNIESLLLRTGSISKFNDEDKADEVIQIMESGLTKDIGNFKIDGYEFFGKIIGKDKIVGDTFGSYHQGTKTIFYFGDATGHGVQAGLTVSMMTKIFFEQAKKTKSLVDLFFQVNNGLKEILKGRVFVTAVFFEHDSIGGKLRYVGAGHDPIFFYKKETGEVEKIIPGGIATGVRRITNVNSIKLKDLPMDDGDVFVGYTDGIIEARNSEGELFGLDRLQKCIGKSVRVSGDSLTRLYELIQAEVKEFMGNEIFMDDVSFFIFRRNSKLDMISDKDELEAILSELDMNQRAVKLDLKGKTRQEIQEEIAKEKQRRELQARLSNMEQLYKIGELARLKQEITYCYKNGYIHEKMDFYLKKIIKNEDKIKSMKLEDRLERKHEMLKELYDKGEYAIVIREAIDVIYKNGNI